MNEALLSLSQLDAIDGDIMRIRLETLG